jgi:hypothetical protein
VLQEIEKKYKDDGLTLLAISMDAPDGQAAIPAYLKKNRLDCRVLLAGEDPVPGYSFQAASSLFVIDRKGLVAGLPNQFYYRFEKELDKMLPDLLAGKPTQGPLLMSMRLAPKGFKELWRVPLETTLSTFVVAKGSASRGLEIGTLDEAHHLKRYSAQGVLLSDLELEDSKLWGLEGADLDHDGTLEWIAFNETGLRVLNGSGGDYWHYRPYDESKSFDVGGIEDLDGDGMREIVVRSGNMVTALRHVPRALWKNDTLQDVKALRVEGPGSIWVQTGRTVHRLDARGRITADAFQAPASTLFVETVETPGSGPARLFAWPWSPDVSTGDLDGDRRKDLLVRGHGGLVVYSQEGLVLLSMAIAENQTAPRAALADLDGKPGDELIVEVPQYGLVAFGKGSATATTSTSPKK